MKKLNILTLVALSSLMTVCVGTNAQKQAEQPNIVLLFVDDLGYMDLGYQNSKFETPNIDQLKKESISFDRAYINTPTCSPSRAGLLTGRHPASLKMVRHIPTGSKKYGFDDQLRTDQEFHILEEDPGKIPSRNWLPMEEITYSEALHDLGYYNAFAGKWHLGHDEYYPSRQGFDTTFATSSVGNPANYYPPYFYRTEKRDTVGQYLTDNITDWSVNFIKDYDKSQPFMLSVWYYNVHSPHIGRKDLVAYFKRKGYQGAEAEYLAMVTAMDESVGRIRKALTAKGIDKNTVVIFTSDQGGYFSNAPLRGGKLGGYSLCEGGARVPLLVYDPKNAAPGSSNKTSVQILDLFPTFIEYAKGNPSNYNKLEGRSLMPLIKGDQTWPDRDIYFYKSYENQYAAILNDNYKLIKYRDGKLELFNLTKDEAESNNLTNTETKTRDKLLKRLNQWEAQSGIDPTLSKNSGTKQRKK